MKKTLQTLWNHIPFRHIIPMLALVLVMTEPSFAQDFTGVKKTLDALITAITGPFGVAVGTLAIMAVGFTFMTGRMDWMFAVAIILGIAILFGAATFAQNFAPA